MLVYERLDLLVFHSAEKRMRNLDFLNTGSRARDRLYVRDERCFPIALREAV